MNDNEQTQAVQRLVDMAGRTSAELGFGRVVGQILAYLYLSDGARSLDDIGRELGLSKASVSVSVRQLEGFGVVLQAWRAGDRKKYYRTADNIAMALRQGILGFLRQKLQSAVAELSAVDETLKATGPEAAFLRGRVARARQLGGRATKALDNPLVRILARL
jgi:DNA-binding transcriptional regulator GbsR (MarR family)